MSLLAPPEDCLLHITHLDLEGVVQFALIHALGESAKTNKYIFKQTKDDGWYLFKGNIDTRLIAEAIATSALEKINAGRRTI